MRVMFYVQHLLGIGHIRRASLLTDALVKKGLSVTVVLGGSDVPGIEFSGTDVIRLPAAHVTDHTFTPLLDDKNQAVDEAWKNNRKEQLLKTFEDVRPDVLLIEMFPFGRRQFRFELLPLLEVAKARRSAPAIVCSVRDILVKKSKPGRDLETVSLVAQYFDRVLVHGDPKVTTFEQTFPEASRFKELIAYTGYIAPPKHKQTSADGAGEGKDEIIVSAGGGSVGGPLMRAAMAAIPLCNNAGQKWRFITGPNIPEVDFIFLMEQVRININVERFRPDLPQMLGNCVLSISQGGYNTVLDLLRGNARAIIVPYDDGSESEQLQRSRLLEERNLLKLLESNELSPKSLARAIDETLNSERASTDDINMAGADTAAQMIADLGKNTITGVKHG